MNEVPNIAALGALIGDPVRAMMLGALLNGRALTAKELAIEGGVTAQTASSHLAKLIEAQFLKVQKHGRHKYFSLASEDVCAVLETMMGFADKYGHTRVRTGPKDLKMRHSRVCYNHLAGSNGVQVFDSLVEREFLNPEIMVVTERGGQFFDEFIPDWRTLHSARRPLCRSCLDWSVRRFHLAGVLGSAILDTIYARGWAERIEDSRVVAFTSEGQIAFKETFPF